MTFGLTFSGIFHALKGLLDGIIGFFGWSGWFKRFETRFRNCNIFSIIISLTGLKYGYIGYFKPGTKWWPFNKPKKSKKRRKRRKPKPVQPRVIPTPRTRQIFDEVSQRRPEVTIVPLPRNVRQINPARQARVFMHLPVKGRKGEGSNQVNKLFHS